MNKVILLIVCSLLIGIYSVECQNTVQKLIEKEGNAFENITPSSPFQIHAERTTQFDKIVLGEKT